MEDKIGYVTIAEADDFLIKRFGKKSDSQCLWLAFDKIESLDYRGQGKDIKFPRLDDVEVPRLIKEAQILESYSIENSGGATKHEKNIEKSVSGIKSKSISDMSVSYESSRRSGGVGGAKEIFLNKRAGEIINKFVRKSYGLTGFDCYDYR